VGTSADYPFSLDLDYLGIPSIDLSGIDGEFTVDEVWDAIKGMPLDKCNGLDGFSAHFFVVCWDIIKCIMAAFNSLSRLVMSHRTSWETPRGRYDEHSSKFSLSMKPRFNRPVGQRNHF
jgi:hypothetical protein